MESQRIHRWKRNPRRCWAGKGVPEPTLLEMQAPHSPGRAYRTRWAPRPQACRLSTPLGTRGSRGALRAPDTGTGGTEAGTQAGSTSGVTKPSWGRQDARAEVPEAREQSRRALPRLPGGRSLPGGCCRSPASASPAPSPCRWPPRRRHRLPSRGRAGPGSRFIPSPGGARSGGGWHSGSRNRTGDNAGRSGLDAEKRQKSARSTQKRTPRGVRPLPAVPVPSWVLSPAGNWRPQPRGPPRAGGCCATLLNVLLEPKQVLNA